MSLEKNCLCMLPSRSAGIIEESGKSEIIDNHFILFDGNEVAA